MESRSSQQTGSVLPWHLLGTPTPHDGGHACCTTCRCRWSDRHLFCGKGCKQFFFLRFAGGPDNPTTAAPVSGRGPLGAGVLGCAQGQGTHEAGRQAGGAADPGEADDTDRYLCCYLHHSSHHHDWLLFLRTGHTPILASTLQHLLLLHTCKQRGIHGASLHVPPHRSHDRHLDMVPQDAPVLGKAGSPIHCLHPPPSHAPKSGRVVSTRVGQQRHVTCPSQQLQLRRLRTRISLISTSNLTTCIIFFLTLE